eukprot:5425090-Amphidinium_carterae.1
MSSIGGSPMASTGIAPSAMPVCKLEPKGERSQTQVLSDQLLCLMPIRATEKSVIPRVPSSRPHN